jgi:site-specific DNA-methyltransferase (adenine-specific)
MIQLLYGDCLEKLDEIADGSVDAIITDPPYSSGGRTAGERSKPPSEKYEHSGNILKRANFLGDTLDQRSWTLWMIMWMNKARLKLKPGGYILSFTDWRQVPATTDAIQAAGFIWRGMIAWDKGNAARAPHKGYFRHQAEYLVWGTNGALKPCQHDGPFPGVIREAVNPREKFHMTGKPVPLMEELIRIVPEEGLILDPFMGSGSTGIACINKGRRFIGIEKDSHYFGVAQRRLLASELQNL